MICHELNPDFRDGTYIQFQREDFRRDHLLYNLTQCGYVVAGEKYAVSRSEYDAFALLYCVRGSAQLEFGGKRYVAQKGDLIFFDQMQRHRLFNRSSECFCAHYLYAYGNNLRQFFNAFFLRHGCVLRDYRGELFIRNVSALYDSIHRGTEDRFESSHLIYEMLLDIMRYCEGEAEEDAQIVRAKEYIAINYANQLTLSDMAEVAHYSKYYFLRRFRAVTGMTPGEYLENVRFEQSKHLLGDRKLSVAQVAEGVGFADRRGLTAAYRKRTGFTPSEYRKFVLGNK